MLPPRRKISVPQRLIPKGWEKIQPNILFYNPIDSQKLLEEHFKRKEFKVVRYFKDVTTGKFSCICAVPEIKAKKK